jgi:hypothetical protein
LEAIDDVGVVHSLTGRKEMILTKYFGEDIQRSLQALLGMDPVREIVKIWNEPSDVAHHELVVGIVDVKVCKVHRNLLRIHACSEGIQL